MILSREKFTSAVADRFEEVGSIWYGGVWAGLRLWWLGEKSMSRAECERLAANVVDAMLRDNGTSPPYSYTAYGNVAHLQKPMRWGHPDFAWDAAAAHELADSDIEYWEGRP